MMDVSEVAKLTGMKPQRVYYLTRLGRFPEPRPKVQEAGKRGRRAVMGWDEAEVLDWMGIDPVESRASMVPAVVVAFCLTVVACVALAVWS